ncbi:hypothetical protein ACOMHN_021253 [Nucella lapillus]
MTPRSVAMATGGATSSLAVGGRLAETTLMTPAVHAGHVTLHRGTGNARARHGVTMATGEGPREGPRAATGVRRQDGPTSRQMNSTGMRSTQSHGSSTTPARKKAGLNSLPSTDHHPATTLLRVKGHPAATLMQVKGHRAATFAAGQRSPCCDLAAGPRAPCCDPACCKSKVTLL